MDCPSSVEVCCDPKDIINPPKPTSPPRPKGCGYRNGNGVGFRIVSLVDHEAEFGEFPWMIAVYQREPFGGNPRSGKEVDYLCGGALIHPKVVVTVAHCVKNKKVQLTVRAGEWDTQTDKELYPQQDRDVASVTIHPQYYSGGYHNDIALLFLEDPVELAPHINVVCLPPQDTVVDDARCFSSGWGKDVFGKEGRRQVILKKIDLPMMPRGQCQENLRRTRLGSHFKLHQSFVCAGGEKGKDTCTGDGGGPLACPIQGYHERYFQVGIVAWGVGCGDYNVPGVYVHVAHFRKWIDEQLI
ncbi:Trypsin domain containing protein, partial [Asbolus verrucosus]